MAPLKSTLSKSVKTALRFQRMQANRTRKFHSNFFDKANFDTHRATQMEQRILELTKDLKKGIVTDDGARVLHDHTALLRKAAADARTIRELIQKGEIEIVTPAFEAWKKTKSKENSIIDYYTYLEKYAQKQEKRAQGLLEAAKNAQPKKGTSFGKRVIPHNLKA